MNEQEHLKSILISIQPKWCELIANGKKTIEVRKTKPKLETPFKCYIYCTLPPRSELFWHYDDDGRRMFGEYERELIRLIDGSVVYDYGMRICVDGGKLGREPESSEWGEDNFLCKKVIGKFVCDYITTIFFDSDIRYGEDFPDRCISNIGASCLSLQELKQYSNGKDVFGWHISDLVIYDDPKNLGAFNALCLQKTDCEKCRHSVNDDLPFGEISIGCDRRIRRPPQSWCYIEEQR